MTTYPSRDESFARLHRAGWSVGNTAVIGGAGLVWLVTGSNGENRIEARGRTQAEVWHVACQRPRPLAD